MKQQGNLWQEESYDRIIREEHLWRAIQYIGANPSKAGLSPEHALGPVLMLGWRFTLAGGIWFALFPAARRGWNFISFKRALAMGVLFTAGMMTQQMGLARTSPAVHAACHCRTGTCSY